MLLSPDPLPDELPPEPPPKKLPTPEESESVFVSSDSRKFFLIPSKPFSWPPKKNVNEIAKIAIINVIAKIYVFIVKIVRGVI